MGFKIPSFKSFRDILATTKKNSNSSHRLAENSSDSGQTSIVLNENTLKGFFLTGRFVDSRNLLVAETTSISRGQFSEQPLNQFNNRTPAPDYASMLEAHMQDGDVAFAIDLHTAVIAGRGFHIKAATPNIVDHVMDFAKDFQLAQFGHTAVMETLGYGSSYYRYLDRRNYIDIEWLPISSVKALLWGSDGKATAYEFDATRFGNNTIPAEEILHLKHRRLNASPFGFGLLQPLISDRDYWVLRNKKWEQRTRPSIMDIKPEMQDVGRKVLRRYIPRHFVKMKGADDDQVKQARTDLKVLEPEEDIVTGADADVSELNKGVNAIDWESWEKLFRSEIITMTENPAIRIFTEPGFTKANADAAIEAVKMLLQGFANNLAWEITNVIIRAWYSSEPYLNANGQKVKWEEAKIEYVWGVPQKPEFTMDHLLELGKLATSGFHVIKPTEFRRNLRNLASLDLDSDDNVEEEYLKILKEKQKVLGPLPGQQQSPQQPQGDQNNGQKGKGPQKTGEEE